MQYNNRSVQFNSRVGIFAIHSFLRLYPPVFTRAEQGYINVNVVAIANVTASSILDTQVCSTKADGWSVVRF